MISKLDGWMASLTRWTWVWVDSGSWWWTGRPGVLRFMGSQRVGHDWATDLIWSDLIPCRSGVRTKFGINMVTSRERGATRLPKEGWTGPGRKRSRSKLPCWSEVGSRLWIATVLQPGQYSETLSLRKKKKKELDMTERPNNNKLNYKKWCQT